jgi:subtilisin-like proprotein convertase family protein
MGLMATGRSGSSLRRLRLAGVLVLALCIGAGLTVGDASAKKKKKHKAPTVFAATATPNLAVPDAPATGPFIPVSSTLTVGKKFKGKTVGDVNVTGITTTGSGSGAASDLAMELIAPNGRLLLLLGGSGGGGIGDVSIGPLTLDDDTQTSICNSPTPDCTDPDQTLPQPFAGTANLYRVGGADTGPLSALNGIPMRGTWTFRIFDQNNGEASVLNGWGLQITVARKVT